MLRILKCTIKQFGEVSVHVDSELYIPSLNKLLLRFIGMLDRGSNYALFKCQSLMLA